MSEQWSLCVHTDDPEGTRRTGEALVGACRAGDLVLLVGGLGAGKTVFAQGFAAASGSRGR